MVCDLKPIVVCGPSGAGKSTFIKKLLHENGDLFQLSISHTTRKPRTGEVNGREYYFVNREEMEKAIDDNEFIENAEFSKNLYGTSKKAIRDIQEAGKICILDIDIQGAKQLKKLHGVDPHFSPIYIFIVPPDMKTLEDRLRLRKTDSEESIQTRLKIAKSEIEYAKQAGNFDIIIKNANFDDAYSQFLDFLKKVIPVKDKVNLNGQNGTFDERNANITL